MGLDSYILRVTTPEELEDRIYTMQEIQKMGVSAFVKDDPVDDLLSELIPYCREVQVMDQDINIEKICADYGLSNCSYIASIRGNGDIGVFDPEKKEIIKIEKREIDANYCIDVLRTYCIYFEEIVSYWRKNYAVQDFFYENLKNVNNLGYYLLDSEILGLFNEQADSDWGYLPEEDPSNDQGLFYHEWY